MCIHESQSLFFEKHLCLSRHFLDFFASPLHECLPETAGLDGERIWSESIRVRPSFIRIEADEVTYPLHVMLRFEIESGLIDGTLEAEDIPDLWDRKMQQYLGLSTRGNDKDGCLQDIHWTDGAFGYFPSYTMGALNAAQIADAVGRALPDWRERLGKGDISPVRRWLHENIWRKGSLVNSQEILRSATGEKTNPRCFLNHLRARYLEHRY
jgi:carboxypeptidase Taq